MKGIAVDGFLRHAKKDARGKPYRGRFTCPEVQWTGNGTDTLVTFTITAEELTDAADNQLLWTDQDVQRGIQPGVEPPPPKELSLASGYPDSKNYIFDAEKADEIADKLLSGVKLFLNPLVWNLRPNTFQAYWEADENSIFLYSGKFYLPDSHHRHQAIIKATKLWRSAPRDYPKFSGEKEFKIELYFLNREDEGNFFFDKNQLPKPTAKSKAYDLTTLDDLSLLAKQVIEHSENLGANVNRVTDKLTARNPQVITLSTLREMMRTFTSVDHLDSSELPGMAATAAQFYDMLTEVRPELGHLDLVERKKSRETKIVDSAVMMHGYAALMKVYSDDLSKLGTSRARSQWATKLRRLSQDFQYRYGKRWRGDLFDKRNVFWQRVGIVKPGREPGRLTVLNTGAARAECGRVLRELLSADPPIHDLLPLVRR